jgi:hypothetical protein
LVVKMTIENATIGTTKKIMSSLINDVEAFLKVSHVELIQTLSKFACKQKPLSFVISFPLLSSTNLSSKQCIVNLIIVSYLNISLCSLILLNTPMIISSYVWPSGQNLCLAFNMLPFTLEANHIHYIPQMQSHGLPIQWLKKLCSMCRNCEATMCQSCCRFDFGVGDSFSHTRFVKCY